MNKKVLNIVLFLKSYGLEKMALFLNICLEKNVQNTPLFFFLK